MAAVSSFFAGMVWTVLVLFSFLPGRSRSRPKLEQPKGLAEFVRSAPDISHAQKMQFVSARKALIEGNNVRAKQLYKELLNQLPGNPVITHSLGLIGEGPRDAMAVVCPHCGHVVIAELERKDSKGDFNIVCAYCDRMFSVKMEQEGKIQVTR